MTILEELTVSVFRVEASDLMSLKLLKCTMYLLMAITDKCK